MPGPQDLIRGIHRLRTPPRPNAIVPELQSDPVISVPLDVLNRHNARVLDPATAVQVANQPPIRTTVYIADALIVAPTAAEHLRETLTKAVDSLGLALAEPTEARAARDRELRALAGRSSLEAARNFFPTVVRLQPAPGRAAKPDAWEVLQAFRAMAGDDHALTQQVSLDHLLTANPHVYGSPVDGTVDVELSSYGRPGWGGRQPVVWRGAAPDRDENFPGRRPVVAVLDTGCGAHDWFDGVVTRNPVVGSQAVGLHDPGDEPDVVGDLVDPLEGELDPDSGHGTFISGLIRQTCPDADIIAVRVMASDGAVAEPMLIDALTLIALQQERAQAGEGTLIDVVSLSLGYYHEQASDAPADQPLLQVLNALADLGVAVVVAAGNDATTRPMYPAAFTAQVAGSVDAPTSGPPPLLSVGARNPDGTIALFSNAGDWVPHYRPGVNLVSTFPVNFDFGRQSSVRVDSPWGVRATIDPDNFRSGFGTWSGTSFAAPILAGEVARALASGSCGDLSDLDRAACVDRARNAVAAATIVDAP